MTQGKARNQEPGQDQEPRPGQEARTRNRNQEKTRSQKPGQKAKARNRNQGQDKHQEPGQNQEPRTRTTSQAPGTPAEPPPKHHPPTHQHHIRGSRTANKHFLPRMIFERTFVTLLWYIFKFWGPQGHIYFGSRTHLTHTLTDAH